MFLEINKLFTNKNGKVGLVLIFSVNDYKRILIVEKLTLSWDFLTKKNVSENIKYRDLLVIFIDLF